MYNTQVVNLGQKGQIHEPEPWSAELLSYVQTQLFEFPGMAFGKKIPILQGGQMGIQKLYPGCQPFVHLVPVHLIIRLLEDLDKIFADCSAAQAKPMDVLRAYSLEPLGCDHQCQPYPADDFPGLLAGLGSKATNPSPRSGRNIRGPNRSPVDPAHTIKCLSP
ncbi:MAG: hypothetical protein U5L00_18305 [Desulfovermiculus sp.]|nr:hypothetical protein [Desulfovermiculus sp.]